MSEPHVSGVDGAREFRTTHWSAVLAAGDAAAPGSAAALADLCQAYWYPLYAHARRRGRGPEDARDVTQGFFAELLARNSVAHADPARGRFRTFLLAAFDRFLGHAFRHEQAVKRGGGRELISWDELAAEQRLALEPADAHAPDLEFDRRWALATLERAGERLRREFAVAGRADLFDRLRPCLSGAGETTPYAELAAQLNLTTVAVKVTVHRLRRRFGEILREEVARTLENPADAAAELRHLIACLS